MRDAAGDIGPGGLALRRHQLGDVVEGHDIAAHVAPRHVGHDADQQGQRRTARAADLHLFLHRAAGALGHLAQQFGHFRRQVRQWAAHQHVGIVHAQQAGGG